MRVLCCHTDLHHAARAAIQQHAPGAELVPAEDDFTYWRELAARWDGATDLVVIEHDVEIHDGVLPQFADCSALRCAFRYNLDGAMIAGLGCAKFSAELQRRLPVSDILRMLPGCGIYRPDAPSKVRLAKDFRSCGMCDPLDTLQPFPCWRHVDAVISAALFTKFPGVSTCIHRPPVLHHHLTFEEQVRRALANPGVI